MTPDLAACRALAEEAPKQVGQRARALHHYGDPPDPRLQEDVDADVMGVVDPAEELATALRAACDEVERLEQLVYDLQEDRKAILSVPTTDGMTASEWIARTGRAEREVERLREQRDRLLLRLNRVLEYPVEDVMRNADYRLLCDDAKLGDNAT